MEFMRLNGLLSVYLSKFINKMISKKVGINPNLSIDHLSFETLDNDNIQLTLITRVTKRDFEKIMEEITK